MTISNSVEIETVKPRKLTNGSPDGLFQDGELNVYFLAQTPKTGISGGFPAKNRRAEIVVPRRDLFWFCIPYVFGKYLQAVCTVPLFVLILPRHLRFWPAILRFWP